MIKVNATRVLQREAKKKAIFIGNVKIRDLIDERHFKVDWWEPRKMGTRNQGYQRKPLEIRKKKIAKYLENSHPIMPTSILINARDVELEFHAKAGNFGELTIEAYPCYIVDGQTRIEGFRYAIEEAGLKEIEDFEMPVIFLSNYSLIEELEQFFILNTTQKRVSTDLAQRLKLELAKSDGKKFKEIIGNTWELKALKVVDLLNTENDSSVWYGRIKLPNTQKSPSNIINQNSFVKSLYPLYRSELFENISVDSSYTILKNYWDALRYIFQDAFSKPKDYVIQKTPGVFSLHDLANQICNILNLQHKPLSKDNFIQILNKTFSADHKKDWFWDKNNVLGAARAGSMKGFARLASEFKEGLPTDEVKLKV